MTDRTPASPVPGFRLRGAPAALAVLLAAARAQGVLVTPAKAATLLYLADLRAVAGLDRPMSGLEWRYAQDGPVSALLAIVEDDLAAAGVVERITTENYDGSRAFRLRLPGPAPAADIDVRFAAIIDAVVTDYGNLAPSTLRDVTCQTPPMIGAQREGARGDVLDLVTGHPLPDVSAVVRRLQAVLDGLPPQEDVGDIAGGMADELAELAPLRASATRALLGDDDCST